MSATAAVPTHVTLSPGVEFSVAGDEPFSARLREAAMAEQARVRLANTAKTLFGTSASPRRGVLVSDVEAAFDEVLAALVEPLEAERAALVAQADALCAPPTDGDAADIGDDNNDNAKPVASAAGAAAAGAAAAGAAAADSASSAAAKQAAELRRVAEQLHFDVVVRSYLIPQRGASHMAGAAHLGAFPVLPMRGGHLVSAYTTTGGGGGGGGGGSGDGEGPDSFDPAVCSVRVVAVPIYRMKAQTIPIQPSKVDGPSPPQRARGINDDFFDPDNSMEW